MAAMFYLLSVVLFFKGRICMEEERRCGIILIVLSVLSAVAAMFTKQNAFTIPLILLLVEFTFFSPSWKLIRRKMALFALSAVLLAVIPVAMILFHGVSLQEITDIARATELLSRYDYFVTQINVVRTYLRLLVFPVGQRVDYYYPIFHSIFNERTILSAMLHGVLITAATASFRKKRAVFFGIAFFYITLLVEASIFPIQDVLVEHRIYLPSVGMIIAASSLMWLAAKRLHVKQVSMWILVGILVVMLGIMTHQRNKAWADSVTLWKDNVEKDPSSWRAHYNLGKAYELRREWSDAKREWGESLKIKDSAWAFNNVANILVREKKYEEALRAFKRSIELDPSFIMPYGNMGIAMEKLGRTDEAIKLNEQALSIDPDFSPAYSNLGRIYLSKGELEKSERLLRKAISLNPSNADAMFVLSMLLNKTGRHEEARQHLKAVLRIKPHHKGAIEHLDWIKRNPPSGN
jgi:Tfp pilus assembly protein PilF